MTPEQAVSSVDTALAVDHPAVVAARLAALGRAPSFNAGLPPLLKRVGRPAAPAPSDAGVQAQSGRPCPTAART